MNKLNVRNDLKFSNKLLKKISDELVKDLSKELYNKLLLLRLETEVNAIKSGKMKEVSSKKLKELLS